MSAETGVSVGEARKATQDGSMPIGTVQQILEAAPKDLKEELVEVPEWGYSVRIRSSSAAQQASIKEDGFTFTGEETQVAWSEMEIKTFQQGVIEPHFDEGQVRQLYISSGPGFNRVVNAINTLNNVDQAALEKAKERFQGPGGSA
jgi:hypothetical protein